MVRLSILNQMASMLLLRWAVAISLMRALQNRSGTSNSRWLKQFETSKRPWHKEQYNCYNVQKEYNAEWSNYFYYDGPGKSPDCP